MNLQKVYSERGINGCQNLKDLLISKIDGIAPSSYDNYGHIAPMVISQFLDLDGGTQSHQVYDLIKIGSFYDTFVSACSSDQEPLDIMAGWNREKLQFPVKISDNGFAYGGLGVFDFTNSQNPVRTGENQIDLKTFWCRF